jgi:hypothetical protein
VGQHLDSGTGVLDDRGADGECAEGGLPEDWGRKVGLKAVHLAAEGVPPNSDVHDLEGRNARGVEPL